MANTWKNSKSFATISHGYGNYKAKSIISSIILHTWALQHIFQTLRMTAENKEELKKALEFRFMNKKEEKGSIDIYQNKIIVLNTVVDPRY